MIVYKEESCPSSLGSFPVRLLPERPRNFSFCKFLKEVGIVPLKKLPLKSKLSSEVALPRSSGRTPEKLLLEAFSKVSPEALPKPTGKLPVKKFWLTSMLLSDVRLDTDFGKVEDSSFQPPWQDQKNKYQCSSRRTKRRNGFSAAYCPS